ncbi:hypothetical protein ABK040_001092 [Willaertia magna]
MSRDWKIKLVDAPSQQQQDIPKPFNYIPSSSVISDKKQDKKVGLVELKQKKCWDFATSPMRGLFMNAFLLWMIGNQINIFPIIFTVMAIFNPIKAILSTNEAFKPFDDESGGKISTFLPKIVYIFFQFVGLGMALVKCYYLGLLPNASDWAHTSPLHPTEFVSPLN